MYVMLGQQAGNPEDGTSPGSAFHFTGSANDLLVSLSTALMIPVALFLARVAWVVVAGTALAIVASTLAIAALLDPLRRRIQSFIDRRFYRKKNDARKTLEGFSAKLRNETNLDALSEDLVATVRETVQPTHVSSWLHPRATANQSMKEWAG